jgi:hypothetical protein
MCFLMSIDDCDWKIKKNMGNMHIRKCNLFEEML